MFTAMNKDPEVMRYFPSTLSDSETETLYNTIEKEFACNNWGLYAVEIKATGEFIGYVGLHAIGFEADFTPGIEIGWRLAAAHHNRGYATEAAKAVMRLAKEHGIKRLYSFTARPNGPSERVMQKIGMAKVGEFNHPKLPADCPLLAHVLYRIDL